MLAPFRIRDIAVDPPLILAPMAGYTSSPMRLLAREAGCGLVVSEVIAVKGILHGNRTTFALMHFEEAERPIGIQLLSGAPDEIAAAIPAVEERRPDFIDINLACPKHKVTSKREGGALLDDPQRAVAVVRAACRAARGPVTAKLRLAYGEDMESFVDLCRAFVDCGAAALALHPRTVPQGLSGRARWEVFPALAPRLGVPLIASGDVRTPQDAATLFSMGCAGVMIGRAAVGNPGLIGHVARVLRGEPSEPPTCADRLAMCLRHLGLLREQKGDRTAVLELRKQLTRYLREIPHAQETARRLIPITDAEELRIAIESIAREVRS